MTCNIIENQVLIVYIEPVPIFQSFLFIFSLVLPIPAIHSSCDLELSSRKNSVKTRKKL